METSSACVNGLVSSSSSFSSFSDQSHLDFYHHRSFPPFLSLRLPPSRSLPPLKPSAISFRALCKSTCSPPLLDSPLELNILMKELADLKLRMKQKKKELKSQKKAEKKRLKFLVKKEKKAVKLKDCAEGTRSKKCVSESSSSSSSESSNDEHESMSMRKLRQEQSSLCRSEAFLSRTEGDCVTACCVGSCVGVSGRSSAEVLPASMDVVATSCTEERVRISGSAWEMVRLNGFSSSSSLSSSPCFQSSNRIEVCTGGKCKKAGSQQLLLALGAQIPSSSNVVAMPCKCMGKCSLAMNVKVYKEDSNTQHHSHARVEDANLILSHHFGLGKHPSTGLPSFPSQEMTRSPSTTVALA